ncbi:SCO3374 family protein [Streptomyces glaucescens]|uniref:SCO3374 family protein n=1 Tax=Streptomyces glaucescens TaxID=1907 RepID=UPI003450396B
MAGAAPQSPPSVTLPHPRRPRRLRPPRDAGDRLRGWYQNDLGWPVVPGSPLRLAVGPRFDVLDVPAAAGLAALRHLAPASPVAAQGGRVRLLTAPGTAQELPGLLDWLEWGSLDLDLTALGEGALMDAPRTGAEWAPGESAVTGPVAVPWGDGGPPPAAGRGGSAQGAAVWVRPPGSGRETGASLPTLSALGGGGGAPDLVRVVDTVAAHCHRIRLRRADAQPLAFS